MTPRPSPDAAPWSIRPPAAADAEPLGALHVHIWQQAYAGLVDAEELAALSVPQRVSRWRTIIANAPASQITLLGVTGQGTDRDGSVGEGEPIGFATADLPRDEQPPAPWELWSLHVHPQYWGTGLGQALLERCVADRDAYLWVLEGNARAIAFYRRNGFDLDGARQQDNRLDVTDLRMVRRR